MRQRDCPFVSVSQRHVILQRNATLGGKRVCLPGKTGTIPCVLSFFLNNDSTGRTPLLSRERKPAIARPRIARRNHGIRRHHHSTQAGLPHPRPIACTRQRARRLRGGVRDPRPRGLRHHLRAAPPGFGRPRHVDLVRRQQQVLLDRLQDAARGRHGRLPHHRALRALRLRRLSREGALRQPAQDVHANLLERSHVPGQDHVPGGLHQHGRPREPHGRLPGRRPSSCHLSPPPHLRAGGLAPRGGG